MSAIYGNELKQLVDILNNRELYFYHACQYKDFKSYLELDGIPSRNKLENNHLRYTKFDTDSMDKVNSVWDKVFGNFEDFGRSFAKSPRKEDRAPTPNPYGPILLICKPEIFLEANDIAITLLSAGGRNFNREKEALSSIRQVNKIFYYENIHEAPAYQKAYLAYSDLLNKRFDIDYATSVEVNMSVDNEVLSFNHLKKIIVDPYKLNNQYLINAVNNVINNKKNDIVIQERRYKEGRDKIIQELSELIFKENLESLEETLHQTNLSDDLQDWLQRLNQGNMHLYYDRFARYLKNGTLLELYNESN